MARSAAIGLVCAWLVAPVRPAAALPITFLHWSDTAYTADDTSPVNAARRTMLGRMNTIGTSVTSMTVSGRTVPLAVPRGVIVTGDLIAQGSTANGRTAWGHWTRDFGLSGAEADSVLKLPVYETWGNHDAENDPGIKTAIRARNKLRMENYATNTPVYSPPYTRPNASGVETTFDGINYSWDWDGVHFASLGFYVANEVAPGMKGGAYNPEKSLEFLVQDLALHVGDSGRPIVISHHFPVPTNDSIYWTADQRTAYWNAIQGYNVVAILVGHAGPQGVRSWNGVTVLDTMADSGSGFFAVMIEEGRLSTARTLNGTTWTDQFTKVIAMGEPVPEPATLGLAAVAAVTALGWRCWRRAAGLWACASRGRS